MRAAQDRDREFVNISVAGAVLVRLGGQPLLAVPLQGPLWVCALVTAQPG